MRQRSIVIVFILALSLVSLCATAAPFEWSVGYSSMRQQSGFTGGGYVPSDGATFQLCRGSDWFGSTGFDPIYCNKHRLSGARVGAAARLSPSMAVEVTATGNFGSKNYTVNDPDYGDVRQQSRWNVVQLLAGMRFQQPARGGRVQPFARVAAGVARQRVTLENTTVDYDNGVTRSTSLALDLGAGIDVPLSSRVGLRVVEVDYNPIFLGGNRTFPSDFDANFRGKRQNNVIFGFGIVVH